MRLSSWFALLSAAPMLAAASQPLTLQPSSQWVVDYGDDSCRLIRMFGVGPDQTKLVFESIAPGDMTMLVAGKPVSAPIDALNVGTRFLPLQSKPYYGVPAKSENHEPAAFWASVPLKANFESDGQRMAPELLNVMAHGSPLKARPPASDSTKRAAEIAAKQAFATETTEIEITAPHHRPVVLATGSLGAAMKSFRDCDRDLLRVMGVDPDVQDKIVRPVWPSNPTQWFNGDIYPKARLSRSQEATVNVRVLVDANGKATKCESFSQYDAPDFSKVVCEAVMKSAKFDPAELADGTKVASYFVQTISFRMAL